MTIVTYNKTLFIFPSNHRIDCILSSHWKLPWWICCRFAFAAKKLKKVEIEKMLKSFKKILLLISLSFACS